MKQSELSDYFVNPKKYKKIGVTLARNASVGEKIPTIIDGRLETINTAKPDDVVLTGPKGEEYIISGEKFKLRYEGPKLSGVKQKYTPIGHCFAVEWKHDPVKFKASWGEDMIIEPEDMLCSPTEVPNGDLYRIEKNIFAKTYKKIEDEDR